MEKNYILALDQGTTSCRAILFDHKGRVAIKAQREFTQFFPKSGWVEHDAEEIWRVQREVMKEAVAGFASEEIAAIGITNQRETAVVWERATGKPIAPAIVWQCRRTTDICTRLRKEGWEDKVREKTGLVIDPYFSATKLMWLLDAIPGLRGRAETGEVLFGTMDTWLIWNLTGGRVHATDVSNASRTMLFNIREMAWDEELCREWGIPQAMLPDVRPSGAFFGETTELGGDPIPVAGAAGDQQAALFGHACLDKSHVKNTYGTGCFMLMNTGNEQVSSRNGLLTTIAWQLQGEKPQYALEGSVFTAGAVIQWLRDGLGLISRAEETEAAAMSAADTGGVYFVPAFNGLGTPYWNPEARGMISGLTRGTRREHIIRAALEAVAYQTADVIRVMEAESGTRVSELRVDGGMVRNRFLMQFQADLLNVAVTVPEESETTSLGAAYLAGLTVGFWQSEDEICRLRKEAGRFVPDMEDTRREALYQGWKRAIGYQTD
ncbi:glycerol kinase GlpK [Gorillibacterium massiliense]|uniref:glycerol kinase GlpK n=1 Tax=Gorillibacterium massiliense TaxID=1280390 RepID=UPI0004AF2499|nr:glycerol kinase GlpK [Gorillibacterium massiliense]